VLRNFTPAYVCSGPRVCHSAMSGFNVRFTRKRTRAARFMSTRLGGGNLVVLAPAPKSPPAKCRDPSAATQARPPPSARIARLRRDGCTEAIMLAHEWNRNAPAVHPTGRSARLPGGLCVS
jgi:hypothetical protein